MSLSERFARCDAAAAGCERCVRAVDERLKRALGRGAQDLHLAPPKTHLRTGSRVSGCGVSCCRILHAEWISSFS